MACFAKARTGGLFHRKKVFNENNLISISRQCQERSVVGSGDEAIVERSALEKI
jgi:hypothetical protein